MRTLRQILRTLILAAGAAATAASFLLTALLFTAFLLPVDTGAQARVQEEEWQRPVIRRGDEVGMGEQTRLTVVPAAGGVRMGVVLR